MIELNDDFKITKKTFYNFDETVAFINKYSFNENLFAREYYNSDGKIYLTEKYNLNRTVIEKIYYNPDGTIKKI